MRYAARCKYRTQKSRQKSPSGHHRTILSGYIFGTKACIDNRKNLLNSNTSSTCPDNMMNFGLPTLRSVGELGALLQISTGFASWQRYCTGHPCKFQRVPRLGSVNARHSSSGRQPNFAALNRGCHLYSAGRPSRWALAHIPVVDCSQQSLQLSVRLSGGLSQGARYKEFKGIDVPPRYFTPGS